MTFLASGRAPLLADHYQQLNALLGVVETAWAEDGALFAIVRFGNGAEAESAWRDVCDGILCNVSVGFRCYPGRIKEVDAGRLQAEHWFPWEISLVTIPADVDAMVRGERRSQDLGRLLEEKRASADLDRLVRQDRALHGPEWRRWASDVSLQMAASLGVHQDVVGPLLENMVVQQLDRLKKG